MTDPDPHDTARIRTLRNAALASTRRAELSGYLRGLAHARRRDAGLLHLARWLAECDAIHDEHPVPAFLDALAPILHRGNAFDPGADAGDAELRDRAYGVFRTHRPALHEDVDSAHLAPDVPFDWPLPDLDFRGTFVFTGVFVTCDRALAERLTASLGARVHPRPVQHADVLVVGAQANPAWHSSAQGRTIQQILHWKRAGRTRCAVIPETHWAAAVLAHTRGQPDRGPPGLDPPAIAPPHHPESSRPTNGETP